jgi:hypothetical protein
MAKEDGGERKKKLEQVEGSKRKNRMALIPNVESIWVV